MAKKKQAGEFPDTEKEDITFDGDKLMERLGVGSYYMAFAPLTRVKDKDEAFDLIVKDHHLRDFAMQDYDRTGTAIIWAKSGAVYMIRALGQTTGVLLGNLNYAFADEDEARECARSESILMNGWPTVVFRVSTKNSATVIN